MKQRHAESKDNTLNDVYREVRFWATLIERRVETLDSAYEQIIMTPRQAKLLGVPYAIGATREMLFREQVAAGLQQWSVTGIKPTVEKEAVK